MVGDARFGGCRGLWMGWLGSRISIGCKGKQCWKSSLTFRNSGDLSRPKDDMTA